MTAGRSITLLLAAVSLLCVSCGGAARQRVAVESVESVERLGWSGADMTLRVRNGLRRDIVLDSCRVTFRTAAGVLAQAELRGGAAIGRRTTDEVRLRFKITAENPSAMQVLWRRMASGETDGVTLDIVAAAEIGGRLRRIYAPARSLSEILSNFGVSQEEFAAWFQ